MNLFLTGAMHVGKSTLLRRVLDSFNGLRYGGFFTTKEADIPGAVGSVYLVPAYESDPSPYFDDAHRVCIRLPEGQHESFPAVFDRVGPPILAQDRQFELIVMDEVGVLEDRCEQFCTSVLRTLSGPVPVFGVLKQADGQLLNAVRAHEATNVIEVTLKNRDALFDEVRALLSPEILQRQDELLHTVDSFGAVVFRPEENGLSVLLVRNRRPFFSFPKGHRHWDESGTQAALREIAEETGICVSLLDGFSRTVPSAGRGDRRNVTFFAGRYLSGDVRPQPGELVEAKWVSVDQAPALIGLEQDRAVFAAALDHFCHSTACDPT